MLTQQFFHIICMTTVMATRRFALELEKYAR